MFNYSFTDIWKKVNISISILFKNDAFLLENDIHQKAITHKLAEYLQIQFPDGNVDCEYNRHGFDIKEIGDIHVECPEHRTGDRVIPDIIIHHRNTEKNLLVIEVETRGNNSDCDYKKLEYFTNEGKEFKYKFGLFIKFKKVNKPKLEWFRKGHRMEQRELLSLGINKKSFL